MHGYPIALIFDEYHDKKAIRLIQEVEKNNIHVLRCTQFTTTQDFSDNIRKADFVFVLLVDDAPLPIELCQRADRLITEILDRDKPLYVIKEYNASLPPDFQGYPILEPVDGNMFSPHLGGVPGMVCNLVMRSDQKQILYEKLSALISIDYAPGIHETVLTLCDLLTQEVLGQKELAREDAAELLRIYEKINPYNHYGELNDYDSANKTLESVANANKISAFCMKLAEPDLFSLACVLRILELSHEIQANCVDIITGGDVSLHNKPMSEGYKVLAKRFISCLLKAEQSNQFKQDYPPEQLRDIYEQVDRIKRIEQAEQGLPGSEALCSVIVSKRQTVKDVPTLTETERRLHDIADYMYKGFVLFESMSHDRIAADFLRAIKTSFERLKNYCDIVEAKAISAQCIHYLAQIDQQLGRINDIEDSQDKASLGLKALLGLKLPHNGQYDVFLSYKHEDEDIARNVYHFLKSQMLNPFFDKFTLPELSDSDYDEAIMNALDHSRHFCVILTSLEQLDSHWIQLEMKTFHHEMAEGRKPDANFIILVTDQVYKEIMQSNKTLLPLRYRSCEVMRIQDYKTMILGYLTK